MKFPQTSAKKTVSFAILLGAVLFSFSALAKTYPPNIAQLSGTNIDVGDTIKHSHAFFPYNYTTCPGGGWEGNYNYKEVRNIVTLFVNDEPTNVIDDTFTVTVRVLIRWKDATCASKTRTVDLTVSYDSARGVQPRERHAYTFIDGNYVEVIVLSVSDTTKLKYVNLRSSIEVTRFGELDPEAVPDEPNVSMGSDSLLRISWDVDPLAEEYDLEWTWVDDFDSAGNILDSSIIAYNFRFNATRVTLDTAGYAFQPIYQRGWLLFRVRDVGRAGATYEHRVLGKWSDHNISSANFFVKLYPDSAKYHLLVGHRKKLNWQYSKTFTEDAQFKEVITYFDGMLKSRQNVTRIETVDMAVVNEDVYDFAGRKAISVIPTPVFNKRIDFYALFNTATTGVEYKSQDFDLAEENCTTDAPPMISDKGATKYYSSSNPYAASPPSGEYWHQYVPQAGGYPYALTTYMPDPTGRVREQGGVGPYHQPTTSSDDTAGHTTKYLYGTPSQDELDMLFGNNVGYAQHYESKITIDPQGNASISYTDLKGNVIATGLVGDVIEGYDTLESFTGSTQIIKIDFNKSTASIRNVDDNDFILSTSQSVLLPNDPTELEITYRLQGDTLVDSCMRNVVCNDCVFELYFSVKDQCGNEMLTDSDGVAQPLTVTLGRPGDLGGWCSSGMTSYNIKDEENIHISQLNADGLDLLLDRGSYTITRAIRPAMSEAEAFARRAVDSSTCLPTLAQLVEEEMAQVDSAACEIGCVECNERLGSLEDFTDHFIDGFDTTGIFGETDSLVAEAGRRYEVMKYNCDVLCRRTNNSPCGDIFEGLRTSFTPGGAYATITLDTATDLYTTTDLYSVFNPDDTKTFSYKNSANGIDTLKLWIGNGYKTIGDLTPHELYIYWQPWIADSLVKVHPEYCHYTSCLALQPSHNFDAWLRDFDDLDSIRKWNYMDLTMLTLNRPEIMKDDSYFLTYASDTTAMKNKLNHFAYKSGTWYNLFQVTIAAVYCNEVPTDSFADCLNTFLSDEDLLCDDRALTAWDVYRNLYLAAKDSIVRNRLKTSCYDAVDIYSGIPRIFPYDIVDTLEDVIALPNDPDDYDDWGIDNVNDHCTSICEGYRKYWMMRLSECPTLAGDSATLENISDALESLCVANCDSANPFSVNYMSTTVGVTKFDSVVATFLSPDECYGIFIDVPGGPHSKYTIETWPLKNDCPCSTACKVEKYFIDGAGTHIPAIVTDEFNYGCGCTGGGEQAEYEKFKELASGESDGCLDECYECEDMSGLVNEFLDLYPDALDSPQLSLMLTHYLNYHTGLDKTWNQYLGFMEKCIDSIYYSDSAQVSAFVLGIGDSGGDGLLGGEFGGGGIFGPMGGGGGGGGSSPGRYRPPQPGDNNDGVLLDECACDSLNSLYKRWKNTVGGSYPQDFDDYVANTIGLSLGDSAHLFFELCKKAVNTDEENGDSDELPDDWDEEADDQIHFLAMNYRVYVPLDIACEEPTYDTGYTSVGDKRPVCKVFRDTVQYYRNLMHTNCWAETSIEDRAACRDFWMDSLLEVLNIVYFGDPNAQDTLEYYYELFKECSCADEPLSVGVAPEREDGLICKYNTTAIADTLISFLNWNIIKDNLRIERWLVEPVTPHYFDGPLNQSPNPTLSTVSTKKILDELYYPSSVPNKDLATSHEWKIVIRDTLSGGEDMSINVTIYSNDLSIDVWPSTGYLVDFSDPVLYAIEDDSITLKVTLRYFGLGGNDTLSVDVFIKTNYKGLYTRECKPYMCREKFQTEGPNACLKFHVEAAEQRAIWKYEHKRDSAYEAYKLMYLKKCYNILKTNETFQAEYQMNLHHVTLFYFDQANNLVQTVPPGGVTMLDTNQVNTVQAYRNFGTGSPIYPSHNLKSIYRYTSLNNIYQQITPDADTMRYWYDPAGRPVLSQDGDQKSLTDYSYAYFDELGRPVETGRLEPGTSADTSFPFFSSYNSYYTWAETGGYGHSEITRTYYDEAQYSITYAGFSQDNLRKRVASITYQDNDGAAFAYGTHYSYDVQGNVKELVQQISELADIGHNYKLLRYDYDLISNKVKRMSYEPGYADAFYHRYSYDADNRVTSVETSSDGIIWDRDAEYFYYLHEPLARIEIGYKRVQGLDFAYTLQGWMKGVNSSNGKPNYDIGRDGYITGGNANQYIARDVFGFTIGYFRGDYMASGSGAVSFEAAYPAASGFTSSVPNLYNGNIRSMTTALYPIGDVLGRTFAYDQLNRLTRTRSFLSTLSTNTWNGVSVTNKYQEQFTYDANGNILTLIRYADHTTNKMDDLTYTYYSGKNRLQRVDDAVGDGTFVNDFDDHTTTNNYIYDQRGNITSDITESKSFGWNNRGKLKQVITGAPCSDIIQSWLMFEYDPMGNRVKKTNEDTSEYYIRDAQGHTMAIYRVMDGEQIKLTSQHIYGSSRLGQRMPAQLLDTGVNWEEVPDTGLIALNAGLKEYELSNHLGNVLATITDRRLQRFDDTTAVDYYEADIVTAQDYYAFGSLMPGRQWTLEQDEAEYQEKCVKCKDLRTFLKTQHSYSLTSSFSPDSTDLTDSLNNKYGFCQTWSFWRTKIYTTCKLWDSVMSVIVPTPGTQNASISFGANGAYSMGTGNFSVEAFVYPQVAGGGGVLMTIAAKYHVNPGSGEIGGFHLYMNAAGQVEFKVGDAPVATWPPGREGVITTTATLTNNAWSHVVAIRSGNNPNGWSIYINGANQTVTLTNPTVLPNGNIEQGSSDVLYIGGGAAAGAPNSWNGRIKKARLIASALTGTQVSNNYNSSCGTSSSTVTAVLDAPLDGYRPGSPATVTDISATNQTGTIGTAAGGVIAWNVFWMDSACNTSTANTNLWCNDVLVDAGRVPRYGFNGAEREDNLYGSGNTYSTEFRIMSPHIGRWFSRDPVDVAYESPYVMMGDNPILYSDPRGDKVNPKRLQESDNEAYVKMKSEWTTQTGLELFENEQGLLDYKKDDKGKAIIAKNEDGTPIGSKYARKLVMKAINVEREIQLIKSNDIGRFNHDTWELGVCLKVAEEFQNELKGEGIGKESFGVGIQSLHELIHWKMGENVEDPEDKYPLAKGPIVVRENIIRKQLGPQYGIRTAYGIRVGDYRYAPLDNATKRQLMRGKIPENGKYTRYYAPPDIKNPKPMMGR